MCYPLLTSAPCNTAVSVPCPNCALPHFPKDLCFQGRMESVTFLSDIWMGTQSPNLTEYTLQQPGFVDMVLGSHVFIYTQNKVETVKCIVYKVYHTAYIVNIFGCQAAKYLEKINPIVC